MTRPLIRHYASPRFTMRDALTFIRLTYREGSVMLSIFALVGAAYGVL